MLHQTAKYAVARWVPGLVNFAAVAIYTRLLDAPTYGTLALGIAWITLGNAILYQWLRNGVRRFLVAYRSQRADFATTSVRAFLILTGVVLAVGLIILFVQPTRLRRELVAVGLVALMAIAWLEINLEVVLAEIRPERYGAVMLVRALLSLAAGTGAALLGYGAVGVLLGITMGYLVAGAWLSVLHGRELGSGASRPAILQQLLAFGVPLTLTYGLETIVSSSDRILLGWLGGAAAVGAYAASYNIAQQAMTTLMVTVNLGGYPMAVRALEVGGREEAIAHLRRHGLVLVGLALPAAVALMLLAPNIAHVLLGEAFREDANRLMPVIACAGMLAGLKVFYFDLAFQLGKETGRQVWSSGGTALANIALSIVFIPSFGAQGAAWASLLAFGLGVLLSLRLGARSFPLPLPARGWAEVALAAGAMGGVLLFLRDFQGPFALVLQCLVGAAAYGTMILVLNVGGLRGAGRRWLETHVRR